MRKLFVLFLAFFVISCGTAVPRNEIALDEWITFDSKTSYHARKTDNNSVYLTIKYSTHTFSDKSAETVPIAKSVFKQIARELSKKNGRRFNVYDVSTFYESISYNDIIGISTVIVSNDVKFTDNPNDSYVHKETGGDEDFGIVEKLEKLKEAFDKGLITEQEYAEKKKQILEKY